MLKANSLKHLLIATFSTVALSGCLFNDSEDEAALLAEQAGGSAGNNAGASSPNASGQGSGGSSQGGQGSAPPSIFGSPNPEALINVQYVFAPDAIDPDSDELTFSIASKPRWANFDSRTGRLSGTPDADDIGMNRNIQISVSDGRLVDRLPVFSIDVQTSGNENVSLTWEAPVENEDGSPLTDLAGYRIYFGTSESDLNQSVTVNTSGVSSYVIENLTTGTWYFAMTSVNSNGVESDLSQAIAVSVS